MGLAQTQQRFTIEQYVRLEADAVEKHEFHDGEILAMSGGSPAHSLICANVVAALNLALRGGPCRVYDANLRVRIGPTRRYVYPDATVICGGVEHDPQDPTGQSVLNPRLIVEVQSPSTEKYDRGEKFDHYRLIESLQAYVLVAQTEPRVEVFIRQANGVWGFQAAVGPQAIADLRTIDLSLPLTGIYAGIDFKADLPGADDAERNEKR